MWRELVGSWTYQATDAGTITLPEGATVLQIVVTASAAATLSILGGDSIPIGTGPTSLRFNHTLVVAKPGALTIVATGTDSIYVEYLKAPGT